MNALSQANAVRHLPVPGECPDPDVLALLDDLYMRPRPVREIDGPALHALEQRQWAALIAGGPMGCRARSIARITGHGLTARRLFEQQFRIVPLLVNGRERA